MLTYGGVAAKYPGSIDARKLIDRPPGRLLGAALRSPVWLYRVRLGWLLGDRFLCIAHRGRRSGKLRRTVVEVVHFDRDLPEATVVAGWGSRTQWYRNLEAAPAEEVRIGRRRWRLPAQRFLDEPERVALLKDYARDHPRAAKELARLFGASGLDDVEIARLAERIRAVAWSPSPARPLRLVDGEHPMDVDPEVLTGD